MAKKKPSVTIRAYKSFAAMTARTKKDSIVLGTATTPQGFKRVYKKRQVMGPYPHLGFEDETGTPIIKTADLPNQLAIAKAYAYVGGNPLDLEWATEIAIAQVLAADHSIAELNPHPSQGIRLL